MRKIDIELVNTQIEKMKQHVKHTQLRYIRDYSF